MTNTQIEEKRKQEYFRKIDEVEMRKKEKEEMENHLMKEKIEEELEKRRKRDYVELYEIGSRK